MGGPGSGRFFRFENTKKTVEESSIIDIERLRQWSVVEWDGDNEGMFRATGRGGSISFHLGGDNQLRLLHKGQDYSVPLTRTFPEFGGHRLWFLCPECKARVGKLYLAHGRARYTCRKCADLTYQSTREMSLAKARKIQDLDGIESIEKMTTSQLINWMKASTRLERVSRTT